MLLQFEVPQSLAAQMLKYAIGEGVQCMKTKKRKTRSQSVHGLVKPPKFTGSRFEENRRQSSHNIFAEDAPFVTRIAERIIHVPLVTSCVSNAFHSILQILEHTRKRTSNYRFFFSNFM